MANGVPQGVQQRRVAPNEVLGPGHGLHLVQLHPVVDHLAVVVEEHRGDQRPALLLPLPLDHPVEPPYGVRLQPRHGAAAIQNKYQFRQIFVHIIRLPRYFSRRALEIGPLVLSWF